MELKSLQQVLAQLPSKLGQLIDVRPVSGGDINQAFRLETQTASLFVKVNRPELASMFSEEAKGLEAIAQTRTIRTPEVLGFGQTEEVSFLALQWHEPRAPQQKDWIRLGEELAALHLADMGHQFGWPSDNFIGSSAQLNQVDSSWAHFFAEQRIRPQLSWLKAPLPAPVAELVHSVKQQLSCHQPKISLLHGDLWSGNVMFDQQGPLLIDPASYWGDAEADIAMTRLFGGFESAFYQAYQSNFGSEEPARQKLYNLYHRLNHANLFGGHYIKQSLNQLKVLLNS